MAVEMNSHRAYDLLGIDPNATINEIKRAFYRLALQLHPDRNHVSLDANADYLELRQAYKWLKFLNTDSAIVNQERVLRQLPPNEFELPLSLEEIFRGGVKERMITRKVLNGFTGKVEVEQVIVPVSFEAGVLTDMKIVVDQAGDRHQGQIPANAVFKVVELPHPHFKRINRSNLEYTAELNTDEAFFPRLWIPSLNPDEKPILLEFDEQITSSTVKMIRGRGLPQPSGNGLFGDILVRFKIFNDSEQPQDPPLEHDLLLSLEQIRKGYNKIIKIDRNVLDANGKEKSEQELLYLYVEPGTVEGTKFPFYRKGDKLNPDILPADIIFTIHYKDHALFKRKGVNIEYTIELKQNEAQNTGLVHEIPTLDEDEKLEIVLQEPITNDAVRIFKGYGLPYSDEHVYGNLIVRFRVIKNYENVQISETIDSSKLLSNRNKSRVDLKRKGLNRNHGKRLRQLPPNEFELHLTLEEISSGGQKEQTFNRKVLNQATGEVEMETVVVQVPFEPGVMTEKKIILSEQGDKHRADRMPANAVFKVVQIPHLLFERNRIDLEFTVQLNTDEACFGRVCVPTLNNFEPIELKFNEPITPFTVERIKGRGLPDPTDKETFGDMVVRFCVFYDTDQPQDPPVEHDLLLTLEQIRSGFTKIIKISRGVIDANGFESNEQELLYLQVKPGTVEGTKFRFYRKGDKLNSDTLPADIIFTIRYKDHALFKPNGMDVECTVELSQSEAQNGEFIYEIPTLDENEKLKIILEEPITNNTIKIFQGYGLPCADGHVIYGNLIVRFKVSNMIN